MHLPTSHRGGSSEHAAFYLVASVCSSLETQRQKHTVNVSEPVTALAGFKYWHFSLRILGWVFGFVSDISERNK